MVLFHPRGSADLRVSPQRLPDILSMSYVLMTLLILLLSSTLFTLLALSIYIYIYITCRWRHHAAADEEGLGVIPRLAISALLILSMSYVVCSM